MIWRLEPSELDVEFAPGLWNVSFVLAQPFVGDLTLTLHVENATGLHLVSEHTILREGECPELRCATRIPVTSAFVVRTGERIALIASLSASELQYPPGEATAPPPPKKGPNRGSIDVQDTPATTPSTQNEPHVSCEFWIRGIGLAGSHGRVVFERWAPSTPTGLATPRGAATTWQGTLAGETYDFLVGPYRLPAGHYRVEAFAHDVVQGNVTHFAKTKTFWVDECSTPGAIVLVTGISETYLRSAFAPAALPLPELTTFALVGVGLVFLAVLHARRR